jgi:transcriptional regulator with XRE-family HTH domain
MNATTMAGMNEVRTIRRALGLSQTDLGQQLGVTQSNIGHYENNSAVITVQRACKLLDMLSAMRGEHLSLDHVYGRRPMPRRVERLAQKFLPTIVRSHAKDSNRRKT